MTGKHPNTSKNPTAKSRRATADRRQPTALLAFLLLLYPYVHGQNPEAVLLVANKHSNTLSFIDPKTYEVKQTIPTGPNPHEITVTPDQRTAYLSSYKAPGNTISVIDLVKRQQVKEISTGTFTRIHGAAMAPDGKNAYFTAGQTGYVVEIDTKTNEVTRTIPTHGKISHMVYVSTDGKRLYTANITSENISVIDRKTGELITQIPCGPGCEGLAFTPDGKYLWALNQTGGTITVIDLATHKPTGTFECKGMPVRCRFTADGKRALVAGWVKEGTLTVIDVATKKEIKRIPVGDYAIGVELSVDEKYAFVGCEDSEEAQQMPDGTERIKVKTTDSDGIHVVDLEKLEVVSVIKSGLGPDPMVMWYPPSEAGKRDVAGKYTVLDIKSGNNNPRNSEGDFITLKDGRILYVYSKYTGSSDSDFAPADLAGRYSSDGGKTWTASDQIILKNEAKMNIMSVSLLRLANGQIGMFYLRKNSVDDCVPMMRISGDEGKTWGVPKPCIADRKGYFVLNNSRVRQLKSGRILIPVSLHKTPDTKWNNRGILRSYYSDDNGKSWKSGKAVPNPDSVITQEPGIVALKDGSLLMNIRANGGFQYYSFSRDQGESWSPLTPGPIPSPVSPASIARIPSTGDLILVWNDNGAKGEGYFKGKRTPLTLAISKDEGKSWQHLKNLENDPEGTFCYTAIHFTKDHVLIGYSMGAGLDQARIVRIGLDEIYN